MPQLIVNIKDKIARTANTSIVCGNTDYTVKFEFDEEWDAEPVKTARFIWNGQYQDIVFNGDTCEVPMVTATNHLSVGVYAGDLRTTTPAIFACSRSILCDEGNPVEPPQEDVYNQIIDLLKAQAVVVENKVDKVEGKGLSTEDFTTEEKEKLANLENYDDNSLAAAIEELETNKVDKVEGKGLSTNDYSDEEKAKLAGITNPMTIKGTVSNVSLLPSEAQVGWFYFVGEDGAEEFEEYCYSKEGTWERVGTSQEGVDLSDYYNKEQIDNMLSDKVERSEVYSKTETDAMIGDIETILASVVEVI